MNNAVAQGPVFLESQNPLIPATYDIVWSAIVFVIILLVFWRVFLPKFTAMLDARAEAIEGNIAKADEAQAKAEEALQEYTAQLAGARQEAGEIRDAARSDATKIVAKAKEDATAEQSRIVQAAQLHIEAERQSAIVSLRKDVGSLAIDLASGVVGENLSDDQKSAELVDRFLSDLENSQKAVG
ncbi:MAG TPA: F0F1 ATP synthase subunit B [Microbacteriaceae bacterium]|nr:F0F1 ATP synthase subunit B [Microbacteriaceae bacterium]